MEEESKGQKKTDEESTKKETEDRAKEESRYGGVIILSYIWCMTLLLINMEYESLILLLIECMLPSYHCYCSRSIALTAMKGLMLQEDLTIEDALKVMEEGQRAPDRHAPMLPPKLLGTLL